MSSQFWKLVRIRVSKSGSEAAQQKHPILPVSWPYGILIQGRVRWRASQGKDIQSQLIPASKKLIRHCTSSSVPLPLPEPERVDLPPRDLGGFSVGPLHSREWWELLKLISKFENEQVSTVPMLRGKIDLKRFRRHLGTKWNIWGLKDQTTSVSTRLCLLLYDSKCNLNVNTEIITPVIPICRVDVKKSKLKIREYPVNLLWI